MSRHLVGLASRGRYVRLDRHPARGQILDRHLWIKYNARPADGPPGPPDGHFKEILRMRAHTHMESFPVKPAVQAVQAVLVQVRGGVGAGPVAVQRRSSGGPGGPRLPRADQGRPMGNQHDDTPPGKDPGAVYWRGAESPPRAGRREPSSARSPGARTANRSGVSTTSRPTALFASGGRQRQLVYVWGENFPNGSPTSARNCMIVCSLVFRGGGPSRDSPTSGGPTKRPPRPRRVIEADRHVGRTRDKLWAIVLAPDPLYCGICHQAITSRCGTTTGDTRALVRDRRPDYATCVG